MFGFLKSRRRKKLLAQPLSGEWRRIIERNVAVYRRLPEGLQRRLDGAVKIMVSEQRFVGCKGMAITDEVKVTIAAQAGLLLLGEEGYYFDRVPSILVYPIAYVRRHSRGMQHPVEEDMELLGESWQRGSIVLSWPAVLSGGRDDSDGQNLVLHEFAHHLDGLDGEMGGTPPLPTSDAQRRWRGVIDREYAQLGHEVAAGVPTLLDPYGTTSEAEFFAVATECFFERPADMHQRHPELYACFRGLYKLDPATWFGAAVPSVQTPMPGGVARPSLPSEEEFDADGLPDSPAELPPLETADQYFTRGHEHFELGRYDLAAADFNRCVRQQPDDQEALLWRGRAYLWQDHVDAALADAERACRLAPDDLEAICLRAMCLTAAGRFEEALAGFEDAADANTDDPSVLYYRGYAYAECGQAEEALADFSRLVELDPLDAEAWHERGRCHEALGDRAAAEADFAKARELGWEEIEGETE
jgi:Mlc titration factor MtfA (ptsG expression regulator)/Flp pilus assembly protein TadD